MYELNELCRALLADTRGSTAAGLVETTTGSILAHAETPAAAGTAASLAALALALDRGPATTKLSADLRRRLGAPAPSQPPPRRLTLQIGDRRLLIRTSRKGRALLYLACDQGEDSEETWSQMEITTDLVGALGVSALDPGPGRRPTAGPEKARPTPTNGRREFEGGIS